MRDFAGERGTHTYDMSNERAHRAESGNTLGIILLSELAEKLDIEKWPPQMQLCHFGPNPTLSIHQSMRLDELRTSICELCLCDVSWPRYSRFSENVHFGILMIPKPWRGVHGHVTCRMIEHTMAYNQHILELFCSANWLRNSALKVCIFLVYLKSENLFFAHKNDMLYINRRVMTSWAHICIIHEGFVHLLAR